MLSTISKITQALVLGRRRLHTLSIAIARIRLTRVQEDLTVHSRPTIQTGACIPESILKAEPSITARVRVTEVDLQVTVGTGEAKLAQTIVAGG